ncbi:MAG: carbohydrate ABC transporter permease [Planctomycetota bacterium]
MSNSGSTLTTTPHRGRTGETILRITARVVGFVILVTLSVTFVVPFLWQVILSLSSLADVDRIALLGVPPTVHPESYVRVFEIVAYAKAFFNSFFIAGWVTLLQVVTSAMAAFAFSRLQWPGRDRLFLLYLATMMIPGVVLMVPNFALILSLGLFNTYAGLIIPAAFSAYGTFLLRQFMLTIPSSLDEAAAIDGAGPVRIFLDVILPLTRPGLIVLTIFTFLGNYNSFFWPLVLIKDENLRTLPIALRAFDTTYGTDTPALMAASLMAMIPPIIIFILLQRYLVKGIQLGAVKG